MQVTSHPADKEIVNSVPVGFGDSSFFGVGSGGDDGLLEFVGLEQSGNFARIQNVVDVLEEFLLDDLRVGEEEHRVLVQTPGVEIHFPKIFEEVRMVVVAGQLDLETPEKPRVV